MKKNKLLTSLIFSICNVVLLFVALVVSFAYVSHGWFSSNGGVTGTGMGIRTKDSFYELDVHNSMPQDEHDNEDAVFNAALNYFKLEANGYYNDADSTSSVRPNFFCKIHKEWPSSPDKVTIEPGAFGTIDFDIVIDEGTSYSFDISLSLIGLKYDNGVVSALNLNDATENTVNELLQGHILLFENRTPISGGTMPYYYSDRIVDTFTYDTDDHSADKTTISSKDHYHVQVYWIWAISFVQIVFEPNNEKLHVNPLFDTVSDDRDDILTYMAEGTKKQKFFYNISYPDFSTPNYQNEFYSLLSNGYNNGDQLIGDTVRYVAIALGVQPSS